MKFLAYIIISLLFSQLNFVHAAFIYNNYNYIPIINDSSNLNSNNESEIDNCNLILGNQFYLTSPMLLNDVFTYVNYFDSPLNRILILDYIENETINSIHYSKLQLNKAMIMNYNLLKKNELGTFGRILGGAVGISAVGLGIYHLIKYKDEYFK